MRNIIACILFLMVSIVSCAPNIHSPQYTSPTGSGYNQQVIGALCSHCGRPMNISWHQYNDSASISCPFCGQLTNTKQACATFKNSSDQRNSQALVNAIQGVGNSYSEIQNNKIEAYKSSTSSCQYKTWTTTVGSKMLFCSQDSSCNVNCY